MKQILISFCLTFAVLLGSAGVSWSGAELKITEITDKDALRKIEKKIKYLGKIDKGWANNKDTFYPAIGDTKFKPAEIPFEFNNPVNGIEISGNLIPLQVGGVLGTHWGKALLTFTRIKDKKSFDLYIEKLIFSNSKSVCEGYVTENFDYSNCNLTSDVPMIIDNNLVDGPTVSFRDIDYDGEEELIIAVKINTRQGSKFIAYNIINTEDKFKLEESPNEISVVYNDIGHEFYKESQILTDSLSGGCCISTNYVWKAKMGTYELIQIIERDQVIERD